MFGKIIAASVIAITLSQSASAFDDNGLPTTAEEVKPFCQQIGELAAFLNRSVIEN